MMVQNYTKIKYISFIASNDVVAISSNGTPQLVL
jgi:hypothetical protein